MRDKRAGRIFGEVPLDFIARSGSPPPPMPPLPPQYSGESSGRVAVPEACTVWPRALSAASAASGVTASTDRPATPMPMGPSSGGAGGSDASPPVQSHWSPDTPPHATSFRSRVDRLRSKVSN